MRFFPALLGALLITVLVFLFMQRLIQSNRDEVVQLPVHTDVEILTPEPEKIDPEEEPDRPDEPPPEPSMEPTAVKDVTPPTPRATTPTDFPDLDLGIGDINVQAPGKGWSAPLTEEAITQDFGGTDGRGYIEVVPFNTRRPNVPEVAWENKISGWVLVAFNVTPDGRTRNVRVLDARPRGVFEERVVSAVQDWTYRVSFSGKAAGRSIVLTQKVEVRWEDYPSNMPNVD